MKQKGITLIQCAITLPLLMVVILCAIDVAFYFVGQGLLDAAASQTASMLSVDPDLDDQNKAVRDTALNNIRKNVDKFGADTYIGKNGTNGLFRFYVPKPGEVPPQIQLAPFAEANNNSHYVHINFPFDFNNAQTQVNTDPKYLTKEFSDRPIEILVHGEVRTNFIGYFVGNGGSIPITGRAIAYRELPVPPSAAPVDPCGSVTNPTTSGCACAGTKVKDSLTGQCLCPGDYIDNAGTCECPGNSTDPDPTDTNYKCNPPKCPKSMQLDPNTMTCISKNCPGLNMVSDSSGNCICDTKACKSSEIQDLSTCLCKPCPSGQHKVKHQNFCHSCPNESDFDKLSCKSNEFKNPTTCKCEPCKTFSRSGGKFFYRIDPATSTCVCDFGSKAQADTYRSKYEVFDYSTCEIVPCKDATEAAPGGTQCQCPSPAGGVSQCSPLGKNFIFYVNSSAGQCKCLDCAAGASGRVADATRRKCECPKPVIPCKTGEFYSSYTCKCERTSVCGKGTNDNRTIDASGNCTCPNAANKASCLGNQRWNETKCMCEDCPGGEVPSASKNTCEPCGANMSPDPTKTFCECNSSISCASGERLDPVTCQCTTCPPGKKPSADLKSCECAGDTTCAGFDPNTCTCAPCAGGTMFGAAGFDHCCKKAGYLGAQKQNLCYQIQLNAGLGKWAAITSCFLHPNVSIFDRWVCSNCDPSIQWCTKVPTSCLKGNSKCEINPLE